MPGPDLLPETGRPAGGTPARVTAGCGTPGPGTPRWAPAGRARPRRCRRVPDRAGRRRPDWLLRESQRRAPAIELSTAVVPQPSVPGETTAYLVIRNNNGPDRLIRVRTSVGGRVTFRAPAGHGNLTMHSIPAISIPGHNVIRLLPNSAHLLITGARSMRGAKEITLTLVFAHAGAMSVIAEVTNPETGGSSYFLNS